LLAYWSVQCLAAGYTGARSVTTSTGVALVVPLGLGPPGSPDGPNAIRDAQRGEVCRHDRLGGLLHEYRRAA
jgi:hypothetical protein